MIAVRSFLALSVLVSCAGPAGVTQVETLAIPPTAASADPVATAPTAGTSTPHKRPPADPELRKWEGVWFDPKTAYKTRMTIEMRGGVPAVVHVEEPIGDKEI